LEKRQICVTIPKECLDWIDKQVKDRTYATRSHAIEVVILNAMKNELTEK
jgi:Arc/MetJ-type ribon-helix-helix transcriptional regulator